MGDDVLTTSIEEMINRQAKRYVEFRLLSQNLPAVRRNQTKREMKRLKSTIERLVRFRNALGTERQPGTTPPAVTNAPKRVRLQNDLVLHGHGGAR